MLYDWQSDEKPIVINELICLAYQSINDAYARTLEEAMLAKKFSVLCFETKTREEWMELRKRSGLKFSIPNAENIINNRDIVNSTSNGKADLMYSIILAGDAEAMLLDYFKEALLCSWVN